MGPEAHGSLSHLTRSSTHVPLEGEKSFIILAPFIRGAKTRQNIRDQVVSSRPYSQPQVRVAQGDLNFRMPLGWSPLRYLGGPGSLVSGRKLPSEPLGWEGERNSSWHSCNSLLDCSKLSSCRIHAEEHLCRRQCLGSENVTEL